MTEPTLFVQCYIINVAFITISIFSVREIVMTVTNRIGFEAFLWASGIWFMIMLAIWYNWPA